MQKFTNYFAMYYLCCRQRTAMQKFLLLITEDGGRERNSGMVRRKSSRSFHSPLEVVA